MHMENVIEVRTWHRKGRAPQLTLMTGACENVFRLTPEEAETLADQLKTHAQFVRHQVKRMRGADAPVLHVAEPGCRCQFDLPNDHTVFLDEHGCVNMEQVPPTIARCTACWHEA